MSRAHRATMCVIGRLATLLTHPVGILGLASILHPRASKSPRGPGGVTRLVVLHAQRGEGHDEGHTGKEGHRRPKQASTARAEPRLFVALPRSLGRRSVSMVTHAGGYTRCLARRFRRASAAAATLAGLNGARVVRREGPVGRPQPTKDDPLRVGENKFTVVARHPDRRTSRKRLGITREAPQPATESNAATPQQGDPCAGAANQCRSAAGLPPNEDRPTPPEPAPCPPGTVPAGSTGACAPADRPLRPTTRRRTTGSERLATTTRTSRRAAAFGIRRGCLCSPRRKAGLSVPPDGGLSPFWRPRGTFR